MIIFLYTIVHTGTYFMQHLLTSHPDIHFETDLNGTTARTALNPLIDALLECKISINQFENLIEIASTDREMALAGLSDPPSVSTAEKSPYWPYMILGSHILPREYHEKRWPMDLFEAGYIFPIVTSLRDPVGTLVSMLIQAGEDRPKVEGWESMGWDEIPDYLIEAYSYLPELEEYGTFFLPVDLMSKWKYDLRQEKVRKLFSHLTGDTTLSLDSQDVVKTWPKLNITTPDKYGHFDDPKTIPKLLTVKDRLDSGRDPRGIMNIVDNYVDELRSSPSTIVFLKRYGYSLPWF